MKQEDWRQKTFLAKFTSAATELGARAPSDIESLKFRGLVAFLDHGPLLTQLKPLKPQKVKGDYQGRAYKLTDVEGDHLIVVEHETGLEILYIAGSLSSIIGLVIVAAMNWDRIRGHWPPFRGRFAGGDLERRRIDPNGKLIEEPAPPVEAVLVYYVLKQQDILIKRISSLEAEVLLLKKLLEKSQKRATSGQKSSKTGADANHSVKRPD